MDSARDSQQLGRTALLYAAARVIISASLMVMFTTGVLRTPAGFEGAGRWGLGILALVSVAVLIALLVFRLAMEPILWVALPFDLAASSLVLAATHEYVDPVYTWLVALVIIYAVVLPRSRAHLAGLLVSISYLVAHYIGFANLHDLGDWMVIGYKAVGIMLMALFVAEGMDLQVKREAQLAASHEDVENLNGQLQRRLAELNAVSEITEVIHSSLDFDAVGPLVLEIIQKVIDLPGCSMLVLDKEKAETLFAASAGIRDLDDPLVEIASGDGADVLDTDAGLYSCITLIDHGRMMVVFCALAEQIENMRVEDRLVLQAVASELAVAVENSQLYKLTKRLAITDELTGLHNYRHMQQRLEDEFERARRFERPLSMLMIDTDDFKLYNDRHGHVAGDHALAELGGLLKQSVREIDMTARYGGEEFAVILPETDAAGAYVVAEKIRETVAQHPFADAEGERTVQLTVSIGLASFPMHAEDRESLLRQADDALYQAKHLGRDRVRAAVPAMRAVGEADDERGSRAASEDAGPASAERPA